MSSLKHIRAIQENGRRSNGPTTPGGLVRQMAVSPWRMDLASRLQSVRTTRRGFCKALELLRRAQTHRAHPEKQIIPNEPNFPRDLSHPGSSVFSRGRELFILHHVYIFTVLKKESHKGFQELVRQHTLCVAARGVFFDLTHKPPATIEWE